MKSTLFIPVRNEIDGVKAILPQINSNWVDEIFFIDGNSNDGTKEYLIDKRYTVYDQKSSGIAGAYWEALEIAKGDIIVTFSPDGNSLPELIPQLIAEIKKGNDLVIASRYLGNAKSEDDDPITAIGNTLFTQTVNWLFNGHYTDTLVMLRAFKKNLVKELNLEPYSIPVFEYQMSIRAALRCAKVKEIPGFEPKRIGGKRKMRPFYNGCCLLYLIFAEFFHFKIKSFYLQPKGEKCLT